MHLLIRLEKETQNSIEKASHEMNEIENIKALTRRFSHEKEQLNDSIEEIIVFYDKAVRSLLHYFIQKFSGIRS